MTDVLWASMKQCWSGSPTSSVSSNRRSVTHPSHQQTPENKEPHPNQQPPSCVRYYYCFSTHLLYFSSCRRHKYRRPSCLPLTHNVLRRSGYRYTYSQHLRSLSTNFRASSNPPVSCVAVPTDRTKSPLRPNRKNVKPSRNGFNSRILPP